MTDFLSSIRETITWGERDLTLETGRLARQADGAVLATYGDTIVLATAVAAKNPREGVDFLPLTVNYSEKSYAAGRIPGGFFKREGRPAQSEILTSRLIDRCLRPLFPSTWRCETQITIIVLSHDMENAPDVIALIAASAALTLSGAPFFGPVAGARVGRIDGALVLNPEVSRMSESSLDLLAASSPDGTIMVESGARELPETDMLDALDFAREAATAPLDMIIRLAERAARAPRPLVDPDPDGARARRAWERAGPALADAVVVPDKAARGDAVRAARADAAGDLAADPAFLDAEGVADSDAIVSALKAAEKARHALRHPRSRRPS